MKTSTKTQKIVVTAVLLILSGCSVRIGYPINYERLSEELSEHEIGQSSFDLNDPLLKKRMILISSGFNRSMAKTVCKQLIYLDTQSQTEPITLVINSNGGDCTTYQSITSVIKSIHAPVDTVNIGLCGSMGALLMQSATGKRYAVKDTAFIIHEPSGRPKDLTKMYKELQEDIFKSRCSLPEDWLPIGDEEYTFSADEALEYEFVDEVIDAIDLQ